MSCLMTKELEMHVGHVMLEVLKVKALPLPARGASSLVGREMRENTQRLHLFHNWQEGHLSADAKRLLRGWTNEDEDPFRVVQ